MPRLAVLSNVTFASHPNGPGDPRVARQLRASLTPKVAVSHGLERMMKAT